MSGAPPTPTRTPQGRTRRSAASAPSRGGTATRSNSNRRPQRIQSTPISVPVSLSPSRHRASLHTTTVNPAAVGPMSLSPNHHFFLGNHGRFVDFNNTTTVEDFDSPTAATTTATTTTTTAHLDDVLDVHTSSMRRAARELLGVAPRMRSRRSIVDVPFGRTSLLVGSGGGDSSSGGASFSSASSSPASITDVLDLTTGTTTATATGSSRSATNYGSINIMQPETTTTIANTDNSNNNNDNNGNKEDLLPLLLPTLETGKTTGSSSKSKPETHHHHHSHSSSSSKSSGLFSHVLQQASAVTVVALLNIMVGIPFGASYFPIGWRTAGIVDMDGSDASDANGGDDDEDNLNGIFPLPGKEALGIRMFLVATILGQIAFTFASRFNNAIGCQMVENIPFLHAICKIVIDHQGYGIDALSTVFFLFALSSILVGATFYFLGKMHLGKLVYYFPNHVLVGCIGGIGVFIAVTGIEVTTNTTFTFDWDGIQSLVEDFHLLVVVLAFEVTLRILQFATRDSKGNAKYPLLSPLFFLMITPIFYFSLWIVGVSNAKAMERGYFFPPINDDTSGGDGSGGGIWQDPHLWDVFSIIDLSKVSWHAVLDSTGTMIALAAFSLIHVPINIPAFAISTDVDADMDAELIAHGYANALSGMCGGLQTYMTYSNSVLYAKSGGRGKISSLCIAGASMVLFVIGPSIASYLPRCMAGTLLFHIGIDLILEGVYDSFGNYDLLEYAGIWAITLVMTIWGMTAAMLAGVIAAQTTYAVQSINYQNPVRQIMTASTLRSSAWARCNTSRSILEDGVRGRSRILIFQLQGHLFFGNVAQLTDIIKDALKRKKEEGQQPILVIIDFTLVVGMDSSAAHAVAKLKKIVQRLFHVEVSIFVTGSDRGGFPCEYALSEALAEETTMTEPTNETSQVMRPKAKHGMVFESLDDALRAAEDILIGRVDASLGLSSSNYTELEDSIAIGMSLEEERLFGIQFLKEIIPPSEVIDEVIETLWTSMQRETVTKGEILWEFGAESDSMKLLICGELMSVINDTGASEIVSRGNIVGELGLVQGGTRLTTLLCSSQEAVLYSLSKEDFARLRKDKPEVALAIGGVVIRYIAHRVQHVSNRYFHTTLPV